jgi:hypothetical protein
MSPAPPIVSHVVAPAASALGVLLAVDPPGDTGKSGVVAHVPFQLMFPQLLGYAMSVCGQGPEASVVIVAMLYPCQSTRHDGQQRATKATLTSRLSCS